MIVEIKPKRIVVPNRTNLSFQLLFVVHMHDCTQVLFNLAWVVELIYIN